MKKLIKFIKRQWAIFTNAPKFGIKYHDGYVREPMSYVDAYNGTKYRGGIIVDI
jgi:hypothetical protein